MLQKQITKHIKGKASKDNDTQLDMKSLVPKLPKWLARSLHLYIVCLLIILLFSTMISIVYTVYVGNQTGDLFMTFPNEMAYGNPGYLATFLNGHIWHIKNMFIPTLSKLENYNMNASWKEVSFAVRGGTRQVQALFLPSLVNTTNRRIVLIPYFGADYLHHSAQLASLYLRSMNISVLIPDIWGLRDLNKNNKGLLLPWPQIYKDVLGAWDYAVGDPQGIMGGKLEPRFVGLMGFEWGSFAAQRAFAVENRTPALLTDQAVFDGRLLLKHRVAQRLRAILTDVIKPLNSLVDEQAWSKCESLAQQELTSSSSIGPLLQARAPSPSMIGIIHSADATSVPADQSKMLAKVAVKVPRVTIELEWYSHINCDPNCEHHESMLAQPREYMKQICLFWIKALEIDTAENAPSLCLVALNTVFPNT